MYITKDEIIYILDNHPFFEVLSEFHGLRKPVLRKCRSCGDTREVNARCLIEKDKFGNYRNCICCAAKERAKAIRKTHTQFINEIKNFLTTRAFIITPSTTVSVNPIHMD